MSRRQDITPDDLWFKNEDKVWPFQIFQADGVTPQPTTGWTVEWTCRDGATNPRPLISKATGGAGIIWTNDVLGLGEVAIDDTDTFLMSAGVYFHLLRRTNPGSEQVEIHGDAWLLAGGG